MPRPALPTILTGLCITQITAWGILYYAFPVLSPRIAEDTGWSVSATTVGYSAGLVVSALLGIPVGKVLDRHGPRAIMTAGSAAGAAAVLLIAWAPQYWVFLTGWLLAGAAMAGTLYPPAFAAVTRWYGERRVFALTVITLIGGLASTVFAPLTEALAGMFSWREVYVILAAVLGLVTVPVHAVVLRRPWPSSPGGSSSSSGERFDDEDYARPILRSGPYLLMTVGFAAGSFAMFAAMINLVPMLVDRGVSSALAAWVLGLGGAGQVLGRLFYWKLERSLSVRSRTLLVFGLTAAATAALTVDWTNAVWLVVISMGAGLGRGISTLLKATAVTDRWGPRAYGRLSGVFNAPVMIAIAVAPAAGAWTAELLGSWEAMYLLLAALGAAAMAAMAFSIPRRRL